jgi:hypothetical protein
MAEHERLEFKIVMDDGPNTEVLARLAHLDLAGPAYRAAVLKLSEPERLSPPRRSDHRASRRRAAAGAADRA